MISFQKVIHPSIHPSSGVFSQPTHCEYVSMFTLHPVQELGSIFSKFKRMSQPWDQSFVQRRLLLGPKEEKGTNTDEIITAFSPLSVLLMEEAIIQRTTTSVWKGFVISRIEISGKDTYIHYIKH